MKITDVKPIPVWVGGRNQLVVKVETDEGIYGWGESGLSGRELAVAGAVKHYREFLYRPRSPYVSARCGKTCTAVSISKADGCSPAPSPRSTSRSTTSPAKALGVPVYQLLGGKQRDLVPCFATTGAAPGPGSD